MRTFLVCWLICLNLPGLNQQPAFPGAEGSGRFTTGGRGGEVYTVTNLLDNPKDPPEGSLRWAVMQKTPRTIVFSVSGTIELNGPLAIRHGDLTIAGQTAPGDGICIRDHVVSIEADNIIIRHLRFRVGNNIPGEAHDAISCIRQKDIIIDHCSMSWAVDEAASFYDNENFTLQWCIISESLNEAGHPKGAHGYGGIWGGSGASFHHNLLASHTSRNPRFNGARTNPKTKEAELVDFRNNVIFNWGHNSAYGGEMGKQNLVNNYYKAGPATRKNAAGRIVDPSDSLGKWYIAGNYVHGFPKITADNWSGGVQGKFSRVPSIRANTPYSYAPVITHSPAEAYRLVLEQAGATLPKRDPVDSRIIREVISGKCTYGDSWGRYTGIIDSADNAGGWPGLETYNQPDDRDMDGMADQWELARGLDPADPGDRNGIAPSGYTWLEEYLNGITSLNEPPQKKK